MLLPLTLTIASIYFAMEVLESRKISVTRAEKQELAEREAQEMLERTQLVTQKVFAQIRSSKASLGAIVPGCFDDNHSILTKRESSHDTEQS